MFKRRVIILCCLFLWLWWLAAMSAWASDELRDYSYFLRQLIDLDRLPFLEEGVTCAQASTYDRAARYDATTDTYINWGANGDYGNYLYVDQQTGEATMAELEGPGCIYRIWSPNPEGKIRFYIDGDTKPTYEFDFNELFSGRIEPFRRPFVWQRRLVFGGDNPASDCYLPIPYAKSCKVTADGPHGQMYHIGYQKFPKTVKVVSFRLPLTPDESRLLDDIAEHWKRCGQDPQPKPDAKTLQQEVTLEPGKQTSLAKLTGPAIIYQFEAQLETETPQALRQVLLQIFWDGSTQPSVEAPLGDFFAAAPHAAYQLLLKATQPSAEAYLGGCFGVSFGLPLYQSLPMGVREDYAYSYWRMPFRTSAHIIVINQGRQHVKLRYRIRYKRVKTLPANTAYFHAKWRREAQSETFDYPFLECQGRGRFVGAALFINNRHGGGIWCEGDEKIYVDGEKFPSTFGTGTEDYFGDAWGLAFFVNPFHGCPSIVGKAQSGYRWHITDNIPFTKSFKMTIENYVASKQAQTQAKWVPSEGAKNDYASMAYWYQMLPVKDFFTHYTEEERLPLPPIVDDGVIEAEKVISPLPAGARLTADERLSWAQGVGFSGAAGAVFEVPVQVKEAGAYVLEAVWSPGTDTSMAEWLYEDRPVGEKMKIKLPAGKSKLKLRLTKSVDNKAPIVLDYLRLQPWHNFIRSWLVIGPFDNVNCAGFDAVYPPEKEIAPNQRYVGKGGQEIAWRKFSAGVDGLVAFVALFADNADTVAYAACNVISPADQQMEVLLGSDDGVKVWLNGENVWALHQHRGVRADEDRFPVNLRKGTNILLVKVDQGGGGWGLCLRFNDPDEVLNYTTPE